MRPLQQIVLLMRPITLCKKCAVDCYRRHIMAPSATIAPGSGSQSVLHAWHAIVITLSETRGNKLL